MSLFSSWLLIAISSGAAVWLLTCFFVKRSDRSPLFIILISLGFLGSTVGMTGGLSRAGVVGDIMAAVLGLFGTLSVWLFAADRSKGALVSICAIAFCVSLFVSYFEGAARRVKPESYAFWKEKCLEKYTDKDVWSDPSSKQFLSVIGELCGGIFLNETKELSGTGKAGN